MFANIKAYCDTIINEFVNIPSNRKEVLGKIADYIISKNNLPVNLVYICTHNSRRSHFGQVWANVASSYYKIKNINSFSGGTEATSFNLNAINALNRIGFSVESLTENENPVYQVAYGDNEEPIECFSKVYNNSINPQKDFAAIMTCSDADENCPFIEGAEIRIATTYNDPKMFDNTPMQDEMYDERCRQIATETFYVFSRINIKKID
ncbi:MAG: protein-tyrosine-phosphatase [Bacteroidota bacterium]|nr:protein-tyrosine-phosphatase [Bacteroidota bacterium]